MERWLYLVEQNHIEQLKILCDELSSKGMTPFSLRELLRTQQENACGILVRNCPESLFTDFICFAAARQCPLTVLCNQTYEENVLHQLQRSAEITLLPEVSYLKSLVYRSPSRFIKAQAVFLDLPMDREIPELLRVCRTRVVLTPDPKHVARVSAGGFFCLPVVKAGESHAPRSSLEIPIEKTPTFTDFPLAPRLAMLGNIEEALSGTYSRTYNTEDGTYRIVASFPTLCETVMEPPEDTQTVLRDSFLKQHGILLHQDGREAFFLYGIHGDTGCYLAMDVAWKPRLITHQGLSRLLQKEAKIILLRHGEASYPPDPAVLEKALEDMPTEGHLFHGRSAAVAFLGNFSRGMDVDLISLRCFMEERLFLAEAMKWFATAESLYVDGLETHLSMLKMRLQPILNTLRTDNVEITPAKRLQWGDFLNGVFRSEEVCLRQCIEERERMATYLRWAEELRKKS